MRALPALMITVGSYKFQEGNVGMVGEGGFPRERTHMSERRC